MDKNPTMSPVTQKVKSENTLLDFGEAIIVVTNGGKITRPGWSGHFVCIHEHFLCLFNPDDKVFHPWLITDSDLRAEDWVIYTSPKTRK